jgi:poly(hydroxyalkanoate) granule-associated protein
MVKKMKSTEDTTSHTEGKAHSIYSSHLAASVKESAQQIWLAGMGAFSKAQEEGTKVFEALVKEGVNLQKKTQGLAEDKLGEVTGKMSAMADTVSAKAGQNWDKLEAIFEQRTAKAMHKLGVPTAKDVEALVKRMDELAAKVAKMGGVNTKAPRAAAAAKTAVKTAAKTVKAPAKKTAAKRKANF